MKRNIAIMVVLVGLLCLLYANSLQVAGTLTPSAKAVLPPLSYSLPSLMKIPTLEDTATQISAWATLQDYLAFAEKNDLVGVKSLSHQLSETCTNPTKVEACNTLMTGIYNVGKNFKQMDFKNVVYDDRQIVLSTDYFGGGGDAFATQIELLFTRDEKDKTSRPKLLTLRYCYSTKPENTPSCVNTDPAYRDKNKNGWWDDVEIDFIK